MCWLKSFPSFPPSIAYVCGHRCMCLGTKVHTSYTPYKSLQVPSVTACYMCALFIWQSIIVTEPKKTGHIACRQVLRKAGFNYCSLPMAEAMSTNFSHIIQQFLTFKTTYPLNKYRFPTNLYRFFTKVGLEMVVSGELNNGCVAGGRMVGKGFMKNAWQRYRGEMWPDLGKPTFLAHISTFCFLAYRINQVVTFLVIKFQIDISKHSGDMDYFVSNTLQKIITFAVLHWNL